MSWKEIIKWKEEEKEEKEKKILKHLINVVSKQHKCPKNKVRSLVCLNYKKGHYNLCFLKACGNTLRYKRKIISQGNETSTIWIDDTEDFKKRMKERKSKKE